MPIAPYIAPIGPIGPINSVVAFTHSDAYTFLDVLAQIKDKVNELVGAHGIQDKAIEKFVNDSTNKINEFIAKFVHHTVHDDENGIIHFAMMNGEELLTYTTAQFDKVFGKYKSDTDASIQQFRTELTTQVAQARTSLEHLVNTARSELTAKVDREVREVREFAAKKANRHYEVVKDHGATGDGVTDDTAAIRKAITAAGKGGHVYFPKGVYRVTGSLEFLEDQYIAGTSGQWGDNEPDSSLVFDMRESKGIVLNYGNVMERMRIEGPGFERLGCIGLHIKKYATIRDCYFLRWDKAVYLEQNWYTQLDRCKWWWNTTAVDANYCYNLAITEPHIMADRGDKAGKMGVILREGTMCRISGGAIEAYQTAIELNTNCQVSIFGTYFETDKQIQAENRRLLHFRGGGASATAVGCQIYLPNHRAIWDASQQGSGENLNLIGNFYKGGSPNEDAGFIIDTNETNPGALQVVALGESNTNMSTGAYRYMRPRKPGTTIATFPYRVSQDRGGNKVFHAGQHIASPLNGAVATGYGDTLPSFGDDARSMMGAMFWHTGKNKLVIFTLDGWKDTQGNAI